MKNIIKFITKIPGFCKLYRKYQYDPDVIDFIIENYRKILSVRAKKCSTTSYAHNIINEIDSYYKNLYEAHELSNEKKDAKDKYLDHLDATHYGIRIGGLNERDC